MARDIPTVNSVLVRAGPSLKSVLAAGVVVSALGLAGCAGFQPLYGDRAVVRSLASIEFDAPQGRAGYLMRQHLDDRFGKTQATSAAPSYRMNFNITEARYPRGVRVDNVATRYEYVLITNYVLTAQPSGAVAKRGQVRVELTYDSADQPYASISAQQDAEDRAVDEAARRIELELSTWLATGGAKVVSAGR
jgi:LPS-assembly lipoprotein